MVMDFKIYCYLKNNGTVFILAKYLEEILKSFKTVI
jgi:hypothetical protein